MSKPLIHQQGIDPEGAFRIFMAAPIPYLVLSPDFIILDVNDARLAVTNSSREYNIGRYLFDAFPDNPEDLNANGVSNLRISLETVLKTKAPHRMADQKYDIPIQTEGPVKFEERYWRPYNFPVLDSNGEVKYIIHQVSDVTEEIKSRNHAIDMSETIRIKDEFISIASHELRTPVTSLKMQLQMTRKKIQPDQNMAPTPDQLAHTLDSLNRQVDKLNKLISDLLHASIMTTGKLTYSFSSENLSHIVQEVLDSFADQIAEAKSIVTFNLEPDVMVKCDRFRIEQVVINLFANSLKYGSGRPITITVTKDKNFGRFSFKDQGIGIEAEKQNKLFQRFERAIINREFSGLGLGLYISKQIVDAHEGKIEFSSELGKGSTFSVEIPLID